MLKFILLMRGCLGAVEILFLFVGISTVVRQVHYDKCDKQEKDCNETRQLWLGFVLLLTAPSNKKAAYKGSLVLVIVSNLTLILVLPDVGVTPLSGE